MIKSQFHGIVPPVITPLAGPDELDQPGFERLLNHIIDGGVHGLFVLGTTGEGPSLSHQLQRQVVTQTMAIVDDRIPVLVGITDTSCTESVTLAKHAADVGANAVVIAPPYYFPAGQTELLSYIERLVEQVPLPVMLYNMPSLTKVVIEIDTLQQLTSNEKIVGVKDSGGDLDYYEKVVALKSTRPDWSVLIGPEAMLGESMALGGDGGVHGGANSYPHLFTRLYDVICADDTNATAALQAEVEKLQAIYDVGKYASRFIKATKSAASIRGLCSDMMAEPFHHFLVPERAKVAAILETLDPELVG